MLLSSLILLPLLGAFVILILYADKDSKESEITLKITALIITVVDLFVSLLI
jgi:NADH:ubiquinone oxidoreductase subunit 4 (subunit M)